MPAIDPATDKALLAVTRKWRIHPLTTLLLWKWRKTAECQRFLGKSDLI